MVFLLTSCKENRITCPALEYHISETLQIANTVSLSDNTDNQALIAEPIKMLRNLTTQLATKQSMAKKKTSTELRRLYSKNDTLTATNY